MGGRPLPIPPRWLVLGLWAATFALIAEATATSFWPARFIVTTCATTVAALSGALTTARSERLHA